MRKICGILFILFSTAIISYGQSVNFFERVSIDIELLRQLNTPGSDISPALVKDELYFSSMPAASTASSRTRPQNMQFYDVYKTEISSEGNPLSGRQPVAGFGNRYHEGPVSWCRETGELFVTLSNVTDGDTLRRFIREEYIRLRLAVMHEVNGKWVIREEFPYNNEKFHFAHPAISPTGDTLIFSSDMTGGFGKSDLYMSVRSNESWSRPQNLGEVINTAGNEMFPTFGPGGMLLFSSDGHKDNRGQLDIYYTFLSDTLPPVHLGEQINSAYDDFGLTIHPSGDFGYFSSGRPGTGSDDIYFVRFNSLYEKIEGKVAANKNGLPLRDATVSLFDCGGNRLQETRTDIGGNFAFEAAIGRCYRFRVEKEGFVPESRDHEQGELTVFRLKEILSYRVLVVDAEDGKPLARTGIACNNLKWQTDNAGFALIDLSEKSDCEYRVTRNGYFDYVLEIDSAGMSAQASTVDTLRMFRKEENRVITLNNLVFYRDMWRIMPESEKVLERLVKLMKDNPGMRVEIASHTDSRLADDYNLWLSQKRSDSITDYMTDNGIEKERLVPKGYGETQLLNHCTNWVECSNAEHLVNRRTEFRILSF